MAILATVNVIRYVPATSKEVELLGLRGRYLWAGSVAGDASGGDETLTILLAANACKTRLFRWLLDYLVHTNAVTPSSMGFALTWTPWGDPVPRVMGCALTPAFTYGVGWGLHNSALADLAIASPLITSSADSFLTLRGQTQCGAGFNFTAYGRIEDWGDHTVEPNEITKAVGRGLYVSPFVG